jgi:IS1 family transposase
MRRVSVVELQADEIQTIVGCKEQSIWVFAVIDVWSRLWPSTVVGKRSYQNTLALFRDLSSRMNLEVLPLITTDGLGFYEKVVGRVFGPACVYGQVIKTRKNDDGQSRTESRDRSGEIGTGATEFGGLSEAEHFVC